MTQVDFYILPDSDAAERLRYVCRLAEKAWGQGNRVYVHTESEVQTRALDKLMWTFRTGSFLPHDIHGADADSNTPILLGHHGDADDHDQVLINLAAEVPLFFSRFARVAEVVNQEPAHIEQGRDRYRFYKERGYPLAPHKIGSASA